MSDGIKSYYEDSQDLLDQAKLDIVYGLPRQEMLRILDKLEHNIIALGVDGMSLTHAQWHRLNEIRDAISKLTGKYIR